MRAAIDAAVGDLRPPRRDVQQRRRVTGHEPGHEVRGPHRRRLRPADRRSTSAACSTACKHAVRARSRPRATVASSSTPARSPAWSASAATVYGATKGAVNQITKGVAIECAPDGIRCNAICPGGDADSPTSPSPTPTRRSRPRSDEYLEFGGGLPARTAASSRAEDCAAAALFLASDDAGNITGVAAARSTAATSPA